MKCIVGLGNPGRQYVHTRHNVGFQSAEFLIGTFSAAFFESTEQYESYSVSVGEQQIVIMMPQTYMNNSGEAVRDFIDRHDIEIHDVLIMYDDFQLPFGTLRLRPSGSDGGHNGLASVIYQLQSDSIPRLRIGVGGTTIPEHHSQVVMSEYVLASFDAEEKKLLPLLYQQTCDACISWVKMGIQLTMNQYNRNFLSSADAE